MGRRPAACLILRIPIPWRHLSSKSDAFFGQHRGLIRLSPGCPRPWGRLDTRYSPVRRSPSTIASNRHAAPRLACVKPVASVHPEPGSNSPLYNLYLSSNTRRSGRGGLSLNRTPRVRSSFLHLNGLGIDGPASTYIHPLRGDRDAALTRTSIRKPKPAMKPSRFLYYFSVLCNPFKELF